MAIDYERVMWDTTKYVNPQNMNQMDEGIKAACDAVDNMSFDEAMTYAEYQALTPEQKADGTTRYIPDYNIGQSVIDNDSTSGTRTWGADKLSSNFSAINSTLATKQATVSSLVSGVSVIAGQTNVKQFGHLVMGRIRVSTTSGINAWTNMLEITGVDKPTGDTYLQVLIDDTDKKNLLGLITNGDNKFKITDSIVANKNYVIFVWYIV